MVIGGKPVRDVSDGELKAVQKKPVAQGSRERGSPDDRCSPDDRGSPDDR